LPNRGWRPPPDLLRVSSTGIATSARRTTPVPHLELNLAPTAEDMPDMAIALIRAIVAAADKDRG